MHSVLIVNFLLIMTRYSCFVNAVCTNNVPCFPTPVDILGPSTINRVSFNVSSVCGNPVESFCSPDVCRLVCNASSPTDKHSKELMIDKYILPTYWKSKNLEYPVTIQLDLKQKLILHQMTITFQFEYPSYASIERSQDFGTSFYTIHRNAISCLASSATVASTNYKPASPVCMAILTSDTSKAISYMPRVEEKIRSQLLSNSTVRNYFLFSNIRYVLHSYITPAKFGRNTADPTKFYFAIRDFDVQASCYCNGMSDKCNTTNLGQCNCLKNTQGDNCEACQPLFNNKPWKYGTACEACNCSKLASRCIYDSSKGHGVCQGCSRNTSGDFCQQCLPGYARDSSNLCIDCHCNLSGALTTQRICNESTGVCICKQNVQGSTCNTCKDEFFGLNASNDVGCSACSCKTQSTINGSNICDKLTGQCTCTRGFNGSTCNVCADGFYGNHSIGPLECKECMCNPYGSLNISCSITGQCYCKTLFSGHDCGILASSYFSASVSQSTYTALKAVVDSSVAFYQESLRFANSRGDEVVHVGYSLGIGSRMQKSTKIIFTIDIAATSGYDIVLRYQSLYTFNGVTLRLDRQFLFQAYSCVKDGSRESITRNNDAIVFKGNLLSARQSLSFGTVCLSAGKYAVTLTLPHNSSVANARILVTALLALPSYHYSARYLAANATTQALVRNYYQQAYSLSTWSVSKAKGAPYLSYVYAGVYRTPQACQCSSLGSVNNATCERYGGQCACKSNVTGLQCDECLPNHTNFTSGQGCFACGCHPFGSNTTSCDAKTGVCTCRQNVIGEKCSTCERNYFGINSGSGCSLCNCSTVYSASQQCHENGTCVCKEGIGGEKCSQCLPGYFNLQSSGCKRCNCNPIGSLSQTCNASTASCPCKQNAAGLSCDSCKPGFYGYSRSYQSACLKCQCSGKTSRCTRATGFYTAIINSTLSTTENNVDSDGWVGLAGADNRTLIWEWSPVYSFVVGFSKLTNSRVDQELFFSAPSKYLGDKRVSHMLKLTFDMTQESANQPMNSTLGDVILVGNNASFKLVTKLKQPPMVFPRFSSYEVVFDERFWRKNSTDGQNVTSDDMIAVLSNLRYLLIRGKWTQVSGQFTGLAQVKMEYSSSDVITANESSNVENCSCPVGYTGLSCEKCSPGYTRAVPYGSAYSACVPCRCYGHAATCDPDSGICRQCRHSTTGNNCEVCRRGYYGNATRGTVTDCSPCPCPGGMGATNQFSPVCRLEADGKPNCTACAAGYRGRRCEMCQDGFSGNPNVAGGGCERCVCSNNIDLSASGNCNNVTGECTNCLYNTTGARCEFCKNGTYGDARIHRNCRDCACNATGSQNNNCENRFGQCRCKPNVEGLVCDRCVVNSFNFTSSSGCALCNCNKQGSNSQQCFENGNCSCKPRVKGKQCDQCMPGFYDLAQGCLPCNCSANFTIPNTNCSTTSGRCHCRNDSLYGGRQCDQCHSNAIGTPPNCALCSEPCYNNWNNYIVQESITLANLTTNTSALLAMFGSNSHSQISTQLRILNDNLTYASRVYEGAQYDTKTKEAQFRQIETTLITYETSVNKSDAQLRSLEAYFNATATFTGTVNLDSTTPSSFPSPFTTLSVTSAVFNVPTTASPLSVTTMAQGYLNSANANNVSGTLVYTTILQNYNQIRTTNQSINQAAADIASAMTTLSRAAVQRSRASSFLDNSFQTTFQANAAELQSINVLVQTIKALVNTTASTQSEAQQLLATAQAKMSTAEVTMNASRMQANAASQAASEMQISGSTLQNSATLLESSAAKLKSNADALLFDSKQTAAGVATSINKVSGIRNQTLAVNDSASAVINRTLPVSMSRIESLSSQITSTSIDERQINSTLVGAEDGLRRAKEVQKVSQKALNSSQETLTSIQSVERSLLSSESLRNSTTSTITANDQKIGEVKNITAFVNGQFRGLQATGEQSLVLINNTISQVNSSLMCFAEAKAIVDNATKVVQSAQRLSTDALLVHQNNTQRVTRYSTQINTTYTTTTQQFVEIQQAQQNATQLLSDVTEAERLLAQFIEQNTEMTRLQAESATLAAELESLMAQYEQANSKFSTCNRN